MDSQVTKQLLNTRAALRKKFKSLKSDIIKSQSTLEKTYKPITQPLKELLTTLKPSLEGLQPKEELKEEFSPYKKKSTLLDTQRKTFYKISPDETFQYDPSISLPEGSFFDETMRPHVLDTTIHVPTVAEQEESQFQKWLEQYEKPLPRGYIEDKIRTSGKDFDEKFGIYFNNTESKFAIGNSTIEFDGADILLGDDKFRYKGTPGLYELLFKKHPVGQQNNDLDNYIDIIIRSNAQYLNHDPDKGLSTSNSEKFKQIIKPRLMTFKMLNLSKQLESKQSPKKPSEIRSRSGSIPNIRSKLEVRPRLGSAHNLRSKATKSGSGFQPFLNYSNKKIEYRHFDDFNEIIDRLRLLIAEQDAGNDSLHNEILSIIEELKEAKIIV